MSTRLATTILDAVARGESNLSACRVTLACWPTLLVVLFIQLATGGQTKHVLAQDAPKQDLEKTDWQPYFRSLAKSLTVDRPGGQIYRCEHLLERTSTGPYWLNWDVERLPSKGEVQAASKVIRP